MLPWVSLVKPGEEDKNIAQRVISHVQYATNKEFGSGFLALRLTLKGKDSFIKGEKLQISYSQPYTYTRLLNLLTEVVDCKRPQWLSLKVGKLGNSLGGLAIPLIIFGAKATEAILSAYQKPVIVLSARVHPGEPPGSFLMEGFIRAMINPANTGIVQKLLTIAEVHVVPMHNPDGVIIGNSRTGLGGVDMNRRWGADILNPMVTPEVATLKSYLKKFQNQVLMFLDLHGHTKGEGIFFYGCDPGQPQIEKLASAKKDSQAQQQLEKWILVRAMPRLACLHSKFFNRDLNKFYSIVDDLADKKLNTARAICFNELGIDLSYTIESSFYGFQDSTKSQFGLSLLDKSQLFEAGDDLLKIIHKITFLTQKLQAGNQALSKALSASTVKLQSNTDSRTQSLMGVAKKSPKKQSSMSMAILEQLRPIYRGVEAQIVRRRARIQMMNSIKNPGSQIGKDLSPRQPQPYKFKPQVKSQNIMPQGLIHTLQFAMQRRKIELQNQMSPGHTNTEMPSQQKPTEHSNEERQMMQATYVGSEWTYEDTGGNMTQYQLLQNESFKFIDQSKPVSCSESEQDEKEQDEERPPIFESLQSDDESLQSKAKSRSSTHSQSSCDSSRDNMEPFILGELEGVIALEKDKQMRDMQETERRMIKQLRREESQLSRFKSLARRNSQGFGSTSRTQIDSIITNARASSQLAENSPSMAMLAQYGKTVTNQFRPHNILSGGLASKNKNAKFASSLLQRKQSQESQSKLSQTQRLSVNARSLAKIDPPAIPQNAKKHYGNLSKRIKSIQPSSSRLHAGFDTGKTSPLIELSLMTITPSRSPAEASKSFVTLAERQTAPFNSVGMHTMQQENFKSKKRSLHAGKNKQENLIAKVNSRLEQAARAQGTNLTRPEKKRSVSQFNQTQKPVKAFKHQEPPQEWCNGVLKIFDMEKTISQERSKSNLSQNSVGQLISRKASISSFKPAPSQKFLKGLSMKKTQQPLMNKILNQNPFVQKAGISVRMQDLQSAQGFSPFNFQQELSNLPQDDSPGSHRPLLPSRFSQITVLGKPGDTFMHNFPIRKAKVEKVPTQLDVQMNPLQSFSNTGVSFFNSARAKYPPPETAYNPDVDAYRDHIGTRNLLIVQQSSRGVQDQNSVRTVTQPSRQKTPKQQDSAEDQVYDIRRNPLNSVLPQIYKK